MHQMDMDQSPMTPLQMPMSASREKAMQVLSVNEMLQESGQRQRREPRTEARDGIACHAGKDEERAKGGEKKQARRQAGPKGE